MFVKTAQTATLLRMSKRGRRVQGCGTMTLFLTTCPELSRAELVTFPFFPPPTFFSSLFFFSLQLSLTAEAWRGRVDLAKPLQLRDGFRSTWATLSPVRTLHVTDHAGVSMNRFVPIVSSVYSVFPGPKTDHVRGLCSTLPAAHSFPLLFLFSTNSSEAFL